MTDAWIVLPSINQAIRFEVHEYDVGFCVYEAAEVTKSGSENGVWQLTKWNDYFQFSEHENAYWDISGNLKWDGCINWHTNPDCMFHGCGPSHVSEITDIFAAIFNFGKRHFDMLGDKPPAMPEGAFEVVVR